MQGAWNLIYVCTHFIFLDIQRFFKNVGKFSTTEKKVRHFWEVSAKDKFFVLRIDGVAAAKLLL